MKKIETHTRCLSLDKTPDGRQLMCWRSHGHTGRHFDPDQYVWWDKTTMGNEQR